MIWSIGFVLYIVPMNITYISLILFLRMRIRRFILWRTQFLIFPFSPASFFILFNIVLYILYSVIHSYFAKKKEGGKILKPTKLAYPYISIYILHKARIECECEYPSLGMIMRCEKGANRMENDAQAERERVCKIRQKELPQREKKEHIPFLFFYFFCSIFLPQYMKIKKTAQFIFVRFRLFSRSFFFLCSGSLNSLVTPFSHGPNPIAELMQQQQ